MRALTLAFYGNYTVQDLLDAAGKFRKAAAMLLERGGASQDALDALLGSQGGQDSLCESHFCCLLPCWSRKLPLCLYQAQHKACWRLGAAPSSTPRLHVPTRPATAADVAVACVG